MSPELERLNPAFRELSKELQMEVEKRMEVGAAFFLLMNAREIASFFDEEKRARVEELRRVKEEQTKKDKEVRVARRKKTKRSIINFLLKSGLVGSCHALRFCFSALLAVGLYFVSVYLIAIPIIYFIISCFFGCSSCGSCPYKVESFEV